jgi:PAS domain-containing protein
MPVRSPDDVALSLTLAVVASSPAPLLLLDGELKIIAASASFCDQFEAGSADLPGQMLYWLGGGEWDTPEIRALMTSTVSDDAPPRAHEMDFTRPKTPTRRLIVQATPAAIGSKRQEDRS